MSDFVWEYDIVSGNTAQSVKAEVERFYKEGWVAQGGVSVSVHFAFGVIEREFAQAMLRVKQ